MTLRRIRSLARPFGLALLFALISSAAHAAAYIKFDGIDGECTVEHFDINLIGEGPQAGLLVPAVQKVREAAARLDLAQIACDGAVLPRMVLDVVDNGRGPTLRYELKNVLVTSYSLGGSGDGAPSEQLALNYEEVKVIDLRSGESSTYDCRSGTCVCGR